MNYGHCVDRKHGLAVHSLLPYNVGYKKRILLNNYEGDELDKMLDIENVLFADLRRIVPEIWRSDHRRQLLPMFLSLVIGLVSHSLAEAVGHVAGAGTSGQRKLNYEFHRDRFITALDRDHVFRKGSAQA